MERGKYSGHEGGGTQATEKTLHHHHRAPWAPWAPWGPLGPMGPLGPLGGPMGAPMGPHGGPLGPLGPQGAQIWPNPPSMGASIFKKITNIDIWAFFGSKMVKKKVEIEGAGPPWRDSQRNSALGRGPQVPNGATATQKGMIWGSLGFRAQPAQPRDPGPRQKVP